jgi:hypothetical protein
MTNHLMGKRWKPNWGMCCPSWRTPQVDGIGRGRGFGKQSSTYEMPKRSRKPFYKAFIYRFSIRSRGRGSRG